MTEHPNFDKKEAESRVKKQNEETEQSDEQDSLLRQLIVEKRILKEFRQGDSRRVFLTKEGIYVSKFQRNKWSTSKIYDGDFKPLTKMIIDGSVVFRVKGYKEYVDNMSGIIKNMKNEGGVLSRNEIDDAVNAVCIGLPVEHGHATYGVYEDKGKLKLCLDVMPIKDIQSNLAERCKPSLKGELSKEGLEAYFKATEFWHSYEVLPAMGMSVMSPFALVFRKKSKLVVIIWHFAPKSHLGKSTVHNIFSLYLFSIYPQSGDSINSASRFISAIDAIGGYIPIHEVDKVDWRRLDDIVKVFPESYVASTRKRNDQSNIEFLCRSVLGISSNRFKISNNSSLTRIFKIEYDILEEGERNKTENTDKLRDLLGKLEPFGWRLVEDELKHVDYSLDTVIDNIESHADELKKLYSTFLDPRRTFSWGMVYEGLKIWERAAIKYGLDWRAPTYETFVEDVVKTIEQSTKDTGITPIDDFYQWWTMWKVKNKKWDAASQEQVALGKGEIWEEKTLEYGGKTYEGEAITKTILREYKKERDTTVDSLTDIAKTIQSITGIPLDILAKNRNLGAKTDWTIFLPNNLWSKIETQESSRSKVILPGNSDGDE